jgi:hypothetical protein
MTPKRATVPSAFEGADQIVIVSLNGEWNLSQLRIGDSSLHDLVLESEQCSSQDDRGDSFAVADGL